MNSVRKASKLTRYDRRHHTAIHHSQSFHSDDSQLRIYYSSRVPLRIAHLTSTNRVVDRQREGSRYAGQISVGQIPFGDRERGAYEYE